LIFFLLGTYQLIVLLIEFVENNIFKKRTYLIEYQILGAKVGIPMDLMFIYEDILHMALVTKFDEI
jgi:hypothetical protein